MKENEKKMFSQLMRRLRVTFPTSLSEKDEALRTEVYWEEFKNTSMEYFEMAVKEAISSCSFFPKPSDLYDFIEPKRESEIMGQRTQQALEWMKPTEEGKKIASEMVEKFLGKLEEEDRKTEELRKEKFEKRRIELQKQAKLLNKKNNPLILRRISGGTVLKGENHEID